jgi:adenylate cyclase
MTVMPDDCASDADTNAVHEQLDRILKSGPFLRSRRRRRFLEYIVKETLAGRGELLKGYNLGRDVFDRSEAFDPNTDPFVRIEAARLRDKLREYYEAEGQSDPIRIDLPKGKYTPTIEFRQGSNAGPGQLDVTTADRDAIPVEAEATLAEEPSLQGERGTSRHMPWRMVVSTLAVMMALGVVGAWLYRDHRLASRDGVVGDPIAEASKVPVIAVLPFTNLSGDLKQDYFSEGLTEDILTELSRARDLRVLARNTTFRYKGQGAEVSNLGRELSVNYVLEGSIQRAADRLRVTAQLIDAETGAHVWADRYDRELADLFFVQDEIVNQIVAKIAGNYGIIDITEAKSATRKNPDQIQAYDLVLRAQDAMRPEWSRKTFGPAEGMLRQAIVLDPSNARAHRELAYLAAIGWVFRFDEPPLPPQEIIAQAAKAVQLDPADARARMVAAFAYFFDKQTDLFEREAQQAIALAPYDGEILATLGHLLASSGQWQRGLALAEKANALNPDAAIGWYHATQVYDSYLKGDYPRALEFRRLHPDQHAIHAYIEYIPIYGELGRKQDAQEMWRKLVADQGSWTAENFESWYRLWNMRDEDIAKLMDGVYKSGVLGINTKSGQ